MNSALIYEFLFCFVVLAETEICAKKFAIIYTGYALHEQAFRNGMMCVVVKGTVS